MTLGAGAPGVCCLMWAMEGDMVVYQERSSFGVQITFAELTDLRVHGFVPARCNDSAPIAAQVYTAATETEVAAAWKRALAAKNRDQVKAAWAVHYLVRFPRGKGVMSYADAHQDGLAAVIDPRLEYVGGSPRVKVIDCGLHWSDRDLPTAAHELLARVQ